MALLSCRGSSDIVGMDVMGNDTVRNRAKCNTLTSSVPLVTPGVSFTEAETHFNAS